MHELTDPDHLHSASHQYQSYIRCCLLSIGIMASLLSLFLVPLVGSDNQPLTCLSIAVGQMVEILACDEEWWFARTADNPDVVACTQLFVTAELAPS
jgi:hypothetical protein